MSYGLVFNIDGSWHGRGKFPATLKDMSNMRKWVIKFFQEFNQVGNKYSKYMSNDGVLLGQEKVNLVNELDEVMGGLVMFRAFLTGNKESRFIALDNKYGYTFSFIFDTLGWDGSGKILNKYVFNIKNFKEWYNAVMEKLKEVFTKYLNSIRDKEISDEELTSINLLLDFLIFDLVVIEKKLVTTDINN